MATYKSTNSLKIKAYSLTKGIGVGNCISSKPFSVGGFLWKIQFYPDGYVCSDEEVYVSLFIRLVSKFEKGAEVYFECALLDQTGNKWTKTKTNRWTKTNTNKYTNNVGSGPYTFDDYDMRGYSKFYKRTELEASRFIIDDCLTIRCTCTVNIVNNMIAAQPITSLSDLGRSYRQLLESTEGSDVSFEVEGEIFYAHKAILSTRSPVFKTQFFGSLKEENTQCIKIEEIHAPVFKALLNYIYCDIVSYVGEDISELEDTILTQHLLVAADRYGIEKLKLFCEARLCENMAENTVASTLALAEQQGCFQLRLMCLEFIEQLEDLEAVMQTDGFKNLKESCPYVIEDLLKYFVRSTSFGHGRENIVWSWNKFGRLLRCTKN